MQLSPGLRKLTLAVHLTSSIGWLGALAGYLTLDLSAAAGGEGHIVRPAYIGMEQITVRVIVPCAIASLITGVVISIGTKWGLLRHYWVLMSLILTTIGVIVLLLETRTVVAFADVARDPAASEHRVRALGHTLPHSIGGTVLLLVILVLNVYKPRGLTRYGWRKQEEARPSGTLGE